MDTTQNTLPPASRILHPRSAFTLVELLVVITIIGILASLITAAAVGALGKAAETRTKAEINQLDAAMVDYKNKTTAFPPNCQTDGPSEPIVENTVYNDLKYHLHRAFPRHQESDNLVRVIAGLTAINPGAADYPKVLEGGISAAEAIPFWTMPFSSDPKYPISGEGGPAYIGSGGADDPIESRQWSFDKARLGPRDANNYFDEGTGRFIIYTTHFNGGTQLRQINFWQYFPAKSEQPYLYFDTSRYQPTAPGFDPPAFADFHVHAFKKLGDTRGTLQFVTPDKFQIIHCGRDDAWGEAEFDRMSIYEGTTPDLLFPDGPFTGDIADTIVNFAEQTRIEDAQP